MSQDVEMTYVLRCHSMSALPKLKTALLSVSAQTYPSVRALVALQNLPDTEVSQIDCALQALRVENDLDIELSNFVFSVDGDHRGALLNRALETVKSRYVAFLDYDDIVYPDHAERLILDLMQSDDTGAVASFGGCMLAYYDDIEGGLIHVTKRRMLSTDPSVSSCLVANCFPIHSYVVDMRRLQAVPRFGEDSNLHEDYIFLLELFERYPVSTRCSKISLCEYRLNNENSNTVLVGGGKFGFKAKHNLWQKDRERVERMKLGRSFKVPYSEVAEIRDISILSRQPLLRGFLVCPIARSIRKKHGVDEARLFLTDPKRYSRSLPKERRSLLMRLFF